MTGLRTEVLSSSRALDKDLGISLQSLMNYTLFQHLTKPHHFCERLRVFRALKATFKGEACSADVLQRRLGDAWPAAFITRPCVWRLNTKWYLVLKTCSPRARVMRMQPVPDCFSTSTWIRKEFLTAWTCAWRTRPSHCHSLLLERIASFAICFSSPTHSNATLQDTGLMVEVTEEMSLQRYLCLHSISEVKAGPLFRYCAWRGLKGANKCSHRERRHDYERCQDGGQLHRGMHCSNSGARAPTQNRILAA